MAMLTGPYADLLAQIDMALDIPHAALDEELPTRRALLARRVEHVIAMVQAAHAGSIDLATAARHLEHRRERHPVTYKPLCRRCRQHPCGCCLGCGWAPDERCEDCGGCGCEDNRCRGGGHQ